MATYKLIQDIEAEDKILGPLTLRQFIFALIAIFLFYMCSLIITKVHAPLLLIVFLPPALFFSFFALPFGRDQPTEVWALAKLRYFFKPRKRVWNQSGVKELVTITVPKKVERILTNGLDQHEVESRLKALANTLDSRGWVVKNVDTNVYAMPGVSSLNSERLIDLGSIPQPVPDTNMLPEDDILDNEYNPIAQQFNQQLNQSAQIRRQQLVNQLNSDVAPGASTGQVASQQNDYWFMNSGQAASLAAINPRQADETALSSQLRANAAAHPAPYSNLRTLQPAAAGQSSSANGGVSAPAAPVTATPDPAILSLANNDDLNVSTLAHEAKRVRDDEHGKDEVTIPLH